MLVLPVSQMVIPSSNKSKSVTGPDGLMVPSKALLRPDAAQACRDAITYFKDRYDVDLHFQDMFRDATEQAQLKKKSGRYGTMPGFSGHNFGMSIDVHVNRIFAQFRCSQKSYSLKKLRDDLRKFGWVHKESAMWHFDHGNIEAQLHKDFGEIFDARISLADLEEILGILGYSIVAMKTFSKALAQFQKDFGLEDTGLMSKVTRRVLITAAMKVTLI